MRSRDRGWATRPAYRRGVRLSVTISPIASRVLDEMLALGLYGRSRAEVAQRLLYDGIRGAEPLLKKAFGAEGSARRRRRQP